MAKSTARLELLAVTAAVLLAGCWHSYQESEDAGADRHAEADAVREADADGRIDVGVTHDVDAEADARDDADDVRDADGEADTEAEAGHDGEGDADVDGVVDADPEADADVDDSGIVACAGGLYDPASGLCWENPASDPEMNWNAAVAYCDDLSLGGHGPGSWHLPTISELRSSIRGCPETVTGGACGVTDSCTDLSCWGDVCNHVCWYLRGPAPGGCYWPDDLVGDCEGNFYWSSSSQTDDTFEACYVLFNQGGIFAGAKTQRRNVRCVRPGP